MANPLVRGAAVLGALALSLVCFTKARADVPFYLGDRAFKQKDWNRALPLLRQALERDPRDLRTAAQLGQAAYQLGRQTHSSDLFKEAERALTQVQQKAPYHAKGWLYGALTELEKLRGKDIRKEEWAVISAMLENAQRAEPGSPWISYMAAKTMLSHAELLSGEEKKKAVEWIRKSVSLHHPYQPSPYLDSALSFLWKNFSDFTLLKLITPPDLASYARLAAFVESKGLWEHRNEINPFYLKLNESLYEEYCAIADAFLKNRDYPRAFVFYDKAAGTNNVRVRAKAGLLMTAQKTNQLGKDWKIMLREVLEEEQDASGALYALEPLVQESQLPYLKGIYAYRRGDYSEARKMLEKADGQNKFRRRYLADAYWQLKDHQRALALAQAVLKEKDPDLRELYTYRVWESPLKEEFSEKIRKTATEAQPADAWKGAGFSTPSVLDRRGRMRVYVNLKPGPVIFNIPMRKTSNAAGNPYIALHLWDGGKVYHLPAASITNTGWKTLGFNYETTGGSRAVEVELMNGLTPEESGPALELGALEIEYPNG